MTFNLTDPANHPANDRLTDERLILVRDTLQRTLTYKNGSTQDYVTADAIKAIDELLERRKADADKSSEVK
ncbi:hypothetical protein GKAS_01958 [Kluyvera ascorbata ATCC 33433]|uniref:hypothetical protein n=1 Tax=Kluyvera ascorbata TaxID=51288 RepID=UPI0004E3C5F9|nr:hypothetical protein [Kluyvera ascorbata]KFD04933.1 hypothetical protein GKAS_01958 [Kluyvera ascorbata ATCC 33433]